MTYPPNAKNALVAIDAAAATRGSMHAAGPTHRTLRPQLQLSLWMDRRHIQCSVNVVQ
jgi:hypothetical protein